MCYNIAFLTKRQEIYEKRYGAKFDQLELIHPMYHANGFGHPEVPVISSDFPRQFTFMAWGLVPFWVKDPLAAEKIKQQTLNARWETLGEKPAFREAYKHRRCLVPVDAFFEHQQLGKRKQAYLIKLKEDQVMTLAGVYETWRSSLNGSVYQGFSIVTQAAKPLMATIHNTSNEAGPRQPLILAKEEEGKWLFEQGFMPVGIADEDLEAYPVSPLSGKKYPGNSPKIWEKAEPEASLF
jgi:putative SOS response-associated peptidase YedK